MWKESPIYDGVMVEESVFDASSSDVFADVVEEPASGNQKFLDEE